MLECEIDTGAISDGTGRKLWSTPLVIVTAMRNAEVKSAGLATPDSHFLTNDYGDVAS